MDEIKLHSDIKKVLANLNRLKFEEYFITDEFNNLLLENGDDDFWEKHKSYTGILGTENRNHTFANCLNYMLTYWLQHNGNSYVGEELNKFLKYVIIGFIDYQHEQKDYSKLLASLDFGPITSKSIAEIKKVMNSKEYLKDDLTEIKNSNLGDENNHENFDYVIITALEDDEMEKILSFSTIEERIENKTYLLRKGHFNSNLQKKIIFISQNFTGFVDSAILSTEIISKYKPKLIIMPGVLGGHPTKTKIGDVIVANKVFTIDKGKIGEEILFKEIESSNINNKYINLIKAEKIKIQDDIRNNHTESKQVDIYFEPIACVRQVIDSQGFFTEKISSLDRKTLGVEMESYGVVRAGELANEGKTDVLIIKSVMDNTTNKTDANKKFAAYTSAKVVEYLFKENLV